MLRIGILEVEVIDQTKLKPCPFCGGDATARKGSYGFFARCTSCPADLGYGSNYYDDWGDFETLEEAIAAWNTRA